MKMNSTKIKNMVMEDIPNKMDTNMKVNGKIIRILKNIFKDLSFETDS